MFNAVFGRDAITENSNNTPSLKEFRGRSTFLLVDRVETNGIRRKRSGVH